MMRFRGETTSTKSHTSGDNRDGDETKPTGEVSACKKTERRRKRAIIWSWTWKLCVLNTFLFYTIFPVLVFFIPDFASQLIFLNYLKCPVFREYQAPEVYGLKGARNVYLPSTNEVQLGVWQMLPNSARTANDEEGEITAEFFDKALGDHRPVIMYCHGNSGSRANPHRVELYKLLTRIGFHVVAVDYRGYGDSSSHTTPDGIHDDVQTVYTWLRKRTGDSPFYIWGHSLGTGISTVFTSKICREDGCPTGLILEAPFNNLLDEVMRHPFGWAWNILPYSRGYFDQAFNSTAQYFQSDISIEHVTCPILILHAEDDWVVPHDLGKKLYDIALEKRPASAGPIKMISFGSEEGCGHKNIAFSTKLPSVLGDFVK
ncbi:lysophosphatidylserine lipase ABHD12 [Strongylocentrotus purpuratus]|uniref:AB hydrolase-1 domain-containing protein n=1 Tax=Strongylocentrotus purpuratus TaxID=7668 RepID=A0A7M7HLY0_STRPU|nr:lysophosphatidylserine lipase ABHD12 [Strongylocentrotus purpuratus]